jgi:hypothetical protein
MFLHFFRSDLQGDQYETLRVPFVTIHRVVITPNSGLNLSQVSIQTTTPPKVGACPIERQDDRPLLIAFDIPLDDVERFMKALDARGLVSIFHSFSRLLAY